MVAVDIKKEYYASEAKEEASVKVSLIFPVPMEENDPYSLISDIDQSLMRTSNGMKELGGFLFGVKSIKGLQLKGFVSVMHQMPCLKRDCCLLESDLDCFNEGHQSRNCLLMK